MKLSELSRGERTITIQWKVSDTVTHPIQITYDPSTVTMGSQNPPDDQTLHDFNEARLMLHVRGWDLMDNDGTALPITPAGIAKMEMAMVSQIITAILDDSRPNR